MDAPNRFDEQPPRTFRDRDDQQRIYSAGAAAQRPRKLKLKAAPKGHEAFLKALEASGTTVQFEKVASGHLVVGTIKASDKFTISVREEKTGDTRVLFKHDVSEFSPIYKTEEQGEAGA